MYSIFPGASSTKSVASQKISSSSSLKDSPKATLEMDDNIMKKKIIILRTDIDAEDSGQLKEEVPVQKKIRVLPEHEGRYKIKMPEGTTPKTQKLLQTRRMLCMK